jgi:2-keto-4-pentenoate hydratase
MGPMRMLTTAALLLTVGCASIPEPACRADPRVAEVAEDWLQKRPQRMLRIAASDAICFRNHLLRRLSSQLGPAAGYKVGLYTKAGQKRFGATEPNIGILHRAMLIAEGQPVSVRYAYSPLMEADFMLVVKDDGINAATTREEVFRHIRGYRPFIELVDNNIPADTRMAVGQFIALNDNARLGMTGNEVPLPQTRAAMDALRDMSVELVIDSSRGSERLEGRALDTLADPLDVMLFAKDALLREGRRLKAGDMISLGAMLPARPPHAGERMRVSYRILGKPSEISIAFVE